MENYSKIYICQIIYRKEKNKRRVNSAKNRGRQRGRKGEKRKERRVGCGSIGKEGKVLSVEDKKRPSRERTHNSVKNWKVAMPYPPGRCPDKYFRRKKA